MKIYRVIYSSHDIDEGDRTIKITTFLDEKLANHYLKECINNLKEQMRELDSENYCVEESEKSYQRYLAYREFEESAEVWLEEDETYDEKQLQIENEKENDYEM